MGLSSCPAVSLIIPVHNGGTSFRCCLDAVAGCSPPPAEVIVVADGESDGSWHIAKERGYQTILLPDSGGPAHARNCGARAASGDILFFIDSDVLIAPQAIGAAVTFFSRHVEYAALIGSYDDTPAAEGLVSQYRNLLHHFTHQHGREEAWTFWAGCGAIRREAFFAAGGFDIRYQHPSIEDIELGYRLKHLGYRIKLDKDMQVKHLKRWNFLSMIQTDINYRAIPWAALFLQQKKLQNDLNVSHTARISIVTAYLLVFSFPLWLLSVNVLPVTLLLLILLLTVNWKFYWFLVKKRGLFFFLGSFPLHTLYYLYSGGAFFYVTMRRIMNDWSSGNLFHKYP